MSQAAFWILSLVFVSRLYLVTRRGAATSFLGATGVGVVGLFCTGLIAPEATLDAWIGGVNWLHLVRNLLVTTAVWLVREGVFTALSKDHTFKARPTHRPLFLALLLLIIVIPFTQQTFIPTTATFVPDTISQAAIYSYASAYMAILGLLSLSVLRVSIGHRQSRTVRTSATVVGLGMGLLVLGCVDEIIYMTLRFVGRVGPAADVMYALFSPLFYSGIVLTSLGLGVPPTVRLWRRLQLLDRVLVLVLYIQFGAVKKTPAGHSGAWRILSDLIGKRPWDHLYAMVIAIGDLRANGRYRELNRSREKTLAAAQQRLVDTAEPLGQELKKRATA